MIKSLVRKLSLTFSSEVASWFSWNSWSEKVTCNSISSLVVSLMISSRNYWSFISYCPVPCGWKSKSGPTTWFIYLILDRVNLPLVSLKEENQLEQPLKILIYLILSYTCFMSVLCFISRWITLVGGVSNNCGGPGLRAGGSGMIGGSQKHNIIFKTFRAKPCT